MSKKEYEEIMAVAKNICIVFAQICFLASFILGVFVFPQGIGYQSLLLLMWVIGIAVYVFHYQFVPWFIEKILKIKIED
jgi:hypothetical protein